MIQERYLTFRLQKNGILGYIILKVFTMFSKKITLLLFPILLIAEPQIPNNPSKPDRTKNLFLKPFKHSVLLTWIDNSDDETGFKIYRNNILIHITKPDVTTYTDTFLESEKDYNYTVKATNDLVFNTQQREIADKFVSIFENGTQEIQYTYAKDINDSRGITAGRAGFTSATGDMLEIIRRYTLVYPNNPLAKYKNELMDLAELYAKDSYTINKNTSGVVSDFLKGLIPDWHTLAQSQSFRDLQDKIVDEFYYLPAIVVANREKITQPLSLLAIYDTYIQHGESGTETIIAKINQSKPINEQAWYSKFLNVRKEKRPDDAIQRADALLEFNTSLMQQQLLQSLTIHIQQYGEYHYIPKDVYESAEDGTTMGWSLEDGDKTTSSIKVDFNKEEENHFLTIGADALSQYKLNIHDTTTNHNFSWKMRYSSDIENLNITIEVETTNGTRQLTYTLATLIQNLEYNEWQTINRNLAEDIHNLEAGNTLSAIKAFSVQLSRGHISVDEIASY